MDPGKAFLAQLKLYTDYLKWDTQRERYETWEEACADVLDTHRHKYGSKVEPLLSEILPALQKKEFLPSMRHLQFRGDQILRNNARLYNCCATYAYAPDVFHKGFYVLLSGAGLGVSMKRKFTRQLPPLNRRSGPAMPFVIPDSIEGWAKAAGALMSSFCLHPSLDPAYHGHRIDFDYGLIRPKGAPITGGFLAPGPDGLRQSLDRIAAMLDTAIGGQDAIPFSSLLAYDIFMHLSDAVLSGGVRRSAMNMLIDPDDQPMLRAKTGDWRRAYPWRARSNNSVGLFRHAFSLRELQHWLGMNRGDNDLGVVFLAHEDDMFNPCYEIGFNFYAQIRDRKESVFQFCNLNEINASACVDTLGKFSPAKFLDLCRKAAILGTLQAGYTDFPFLGAQTGEIVAGEALLGISVTGWMCRPELFDPEILTRGAEIIKATNREVASLISIRPGARTTTVKPSGNASVVLQTSSGIHPEHARRYFRIMQLARQAPTAQYLETHHPDMLEPSRWSATGSDYAVFVPCENRDNVILKEDMQGVRHLQLIELVRRAWVLPGKTESLCYRATTSHNVSNTVILDDEAEVARYLFDHQDHFTAVSFLAPSGDKEYVQAPYTAVLTEQEFASQYGERSEVFRQMIQTGLRVFDNDLWQACTFLTNQETYVSDRPPFSKDQEIWRIEAARVSDALYAGDRVRLGHALKDRYLSDKWHQILHTFRVPDLAQILRHPAPVEIRQTNAVACQADYCDTDLPPTPAKKGMTR